MESGSDADDSDADEKHVRNNELQAIRDEVARRLSKEVGIFNSLRVARMHTGEDILDFFGTHDASIPAHGLTFMSSGNVKGGQCNVEQVFSAAGLTLSLNRTRLTPKKFEALVMIKQNRNNCEPSTAELKASDIVCV